MLQRLVGALPGWWPYALGAIAIAMSLAASLHVVVRKRDVRAAIGWVGLIWFVPGLGAFLYAMFGLNRIQRRASLLYRARRRLPLSTPNATSIARTGSANEVASGLTTLARLGEQMSGRPLLTGNRLEMLHNGDEACPAMIAAIEGARHSVALVSYIFADDRAGRGFVDAMGRAVARGVEVRVLVDGVGVRYSWPLVHRSLRKVGVKAELFLPTITQAGLAFFNLRNHRKALIVDGRLAYTGGMNIWERCVLSNNAPNSVRDLHFRVEGPVVGQIMESFAEDWLFSAREVLEGANWFPSLVHAGPTTTRVITDGPDGDLEVTRTVLLGAIATARQRIRIVTPYFLPDQAMIAALAVAALRGVRVEIVLPSQVNVPLIQWASTAQFWQVLRPGCRIFLTPMPFDHTKLAVIDGIWSLVGSTNWDPRSLRLNFELDVEAYDPTFGARLDEVVDAKIATAREISLAEVDARPPHIKVRDGLARLGSPYL